MQVSLDLGIQRCVVTSERVCMQEPGNSSIIPCRNKHILPTSIFVAKCEKPNETFQYNTSLFASRVTSIGYDLFVCIVLVQVNKVNMPWTSKPSNVTSQAVITGYGCLFSFTSFHLPVVV